MLCLHSDERKNAVHREQGKTEVSLRRRFAYDRTSSCCLLLFLWSFILNINTILSTKTRYTKKNNLKKAYTN